MNQNVHSPQMGYVHAAIIDEGGVGANKLAKTEQTLAGLSEGVWEETGARRRLGWSTSSVCACWLQCDEWPQRRLLVGRRFMREGEMIWNYAGVLTNLREKDVGYGQLRHPQADQ